MDNQFLGETDGNLVRDSSILGQSANGDPFNLFDSVIYGTSNVKLGKHTQILSGDIFVQDPGGLLQIKKGGISGNDIDIAAHSIRLGKRTNISGDASFNTLKNRGLIQGQELTPSSFPTFDGVLDNLIHFNTANPGSRDIFVGKGETLSITPGRYDDITVKKGGTLIFDGEGVYDIDSLNAKKRTHILFDGDGTIDVRVQDYVKVKGKSRFGPTDNASIDASDIVFYVEGQERANKPVWFGRKIDLDANFYNKTGKLRLGRKSDVEGAFISPTVVLKKRIQLNYNSYFSNNLTESIPPEIIAGLSHDTGRSDSDKITNNASLTGQLIDESDIVDFHFAPEGVEQANAFDILPFLDQEGQFQIEQTELEQLLGQSLTEGTNTFNFWATDKFGNEGQSQFSITLDTQIKFPETSLVPAFDTPPLNDSQTTNAVVNFKGLTDSDAEVRISGQGQPYQSDDQGQFLIESIPLKFGNNPFTVTAIDIAGNQGEFSFEVERVPEAVNTAPTITASQTQSTLNDSQLIINGIEVSDSDAEDKEIELSLEVNNGSLTLGQINGLTFLKGDGNDDDEMQFQGKLADINAALAALVYQSNNGFVGADQLTITVDDLGNSGAGGPLSAEHIIVIDVTQANRDPQAEANKSFSIQEDSDATALNIAAPTDPDGDDLKVIVTELPNAALGRVQTSNDTPINLNEALTVAELIALEFLPVTNQVGDAGFFSYRVEDGEGGSDTQSIDITIEPLNDRPLLTVPANLSVNQVESIEITGITLSDLDVGNEDLEVTLNVENGTLSLGSVSGLNFSQGDGNNDTAIQFSGTLNDISLALNSLNYQPDLSFFGTTTLIITVSDLGNTGAGGALEDSKTVQINVIDTNIKLEEGTQFQTTVTQDITVPNEPSVLQFNLDAVNFDSSDTHSINDAFEAAFVDENGNSLVHTIAGSRDAFFNSTEGESSAFANGVSQDGQVIKLNLAGVTPGTQGKLILRLVNNDDDTSTSAEIDDIEVVAEAIEAPGGITPETSLAALSFIREEIDFDGLSDLSPSFEASYGQTSFNEETQTLFSDIALKNIGQYEAKSPLLVAISLNNSAISVPGADGVTSDGLPYYDFSQFISDGGIDPDESTTNKTIEFYNPQKVQFDYELIVLGQLNRGPSFTSQPILEILAGQSYQYQSDATDPDSDSLTYQLKIAPEGMSIDPQTGEIQWDTTAADIGSTTVQILVEDGQGGQDVQTYALNVLETVPNRPPLITSTPVISANIDTEYVYQVIATDRDQDELTYAIAQGPEGLEIDANTGEIRWTPSAEIALGEYDVTLEVTDGKNGKAEQNYQIVLLETPGNQAPVIVSTPITKVNLEDEVASEPIPVDLSTWSTINYAGSQGPSNWEIVPGSNNTEVIQTINSEPSIFIGDFELANSQVTGSWKVNTSGDDDLMGFVFGYQDEEHFYLFDWKQSGQNAGVGLAERGMSLKVVSSDSPLTEADLWPSQGNGERVRTLYRNDIGWEDLTDYEFSLEFLNGSFTITVTEQESGTVIDSFTIEDDTYTNGKFGFYNYSQDRVEYKGFAQTSLGRGTYLYDTNAIDPDMDPVMYELVNAPEGMSINPDSGFIQWRLASDSLGSHEIEVVAKDNRGGRDVQTYTLEVRDDQLGALQGRVMEPLNLEGADSPVMVTVPGTADPWLAGLPDGTTASAGDVAPDESPILVDGLQLDNVTFLTFDATGAVNFTPTPPSPTATPDGVNIGTHATGAENGFSSLSAPINGLIGVFLGSDQPDLSSSPRALDFGTSGNVIGGINYLSLVPELKQPFFIGDGKNSEGELQKVIVPESATRFYLGTMDGSGWFNNSGEIEVTVTPGGIPSQVGQANAQVFLDLNNNGVLDLDEPSQITAQDNPNTLTIDELGQYEFSDLFDGSYTVRLIVPEGFRQISPEDNDGYTVEILDGETIANLDFINQQVGTVSNQDPEITSAPVTSFEQGQRYVYQVLANDPNPDTLVYDLPVKPTGMVIDPETGLIAWNPDKGQVGQTAVVVRVQDGKGGVDLQTYSLNILPPNTTPIITSEPPTQAGVNVPLIYQVTAQDEESDTLTYSLANRPAGANIDPDSGRVTWTPDAVGNGEFLVVVTDLRGAVATQSFMIEAIADFANNAPTISSTPRNAVRVGDTYRYQIIANDIDNEPLTYSLDDAPEGMTLSPEGLIEWDTTAEQFGANAVALTVTDSRGATAQQRFNVTVGSQTTNEAPVFESEPPKVAIAGETFIYQPVVIDPDGDDLGFYSPVLVDLFQQLQIGNNSNTPVNVSAQTPGFSINSKTGEVRWTPDFDDVGRKRLGIVAVDPYGGMTDQIFDFEVVAGNRPPLFTSVPITQAAVGDRYTYTIEASDPDGGDVMLTLEDAPDGMALDDMTLVWQPDATQLGESMIVIRATDEQGASTTQTYDVAVTETLPNRAPVINSVPSFVASPDTLYQYQVTATDPEGDSIAYSLENAPDGVTIDPVTGLLEWTPSVDQLGVVEVSLKAVDPAGLGSVQTFSIAVAVNTAPTIDSTPETELSAGATYQYDVQASDAEGDRLSYRLVQGPAGMTIDALGRLIWETSNVDAGSFDVAIEVSDSRGAMATQSFQLEVSADTEAPMVTLIQNNTVVDLGESVTFQVNATDNVGVESLTLTIDGVPVALDANGRAEVVLDGVTPIEAVATATDAAGNVGTDSATAQGIDRSDVDAPFLEITSINDGDIFTAPTDIVGTVNDDNLVSYSVEVAKVAGGEFVEIASGTTVVVDGKIAQFDPTILQNDSYILRLTAIDAGGNISTIQRQVNVEGELKLGDFQVAFTDLTIPVAGIPITVSRIYDTLNANTRDDFGFGWSLGLADTDLRTDVPASGLEASDIYSPFEIGSRVYVTNPVTGRREGYTFTVESPSRFAVFGNVRPRFIPDAGVTSTLSVDRIDLSVTDTNEVVSFIGGLPYNPASGLFGGSYTLTTKEGVAFRINGDTGDVERVTDRNGNTLEFTDAGILSSTGESISFERDPQGRIIAVIDPAGNRIEYRYDANGDLVAVTDREGNEIRFSYSEDRAHYLDEIIDPLGRETIRNEYDEAGRLTKILDAQGAPIDFTYDPENRVTTSSEILDEEGTVALTITESDLRGNILRQVNPNGGEVNRTYDTNDNLLTETDALGRTTSFSYDSRRNILSETDPLGNVSRFTYNSTSDLTSLTDPLGNTSSFTYNNGNLISETDALGRESQYEYDASGSLLNLNSVSGFREIQRSFTYDELGRQISEIDGLGSKTILELDELGRTIRSSTDVTTVDSIETLSTVFDYDFEGRLIGITDAEGNTGTTTYDAIGQILSETDALGRVTSYTYNERGERTQITYPDGSTELFEYDLGGRLIAQTDQVGRTTHFDYDPMDRLIATILPDGTTTDLSDNPRELREYDLAGQLIATIDPLGNRTQFVYDATGREIEVIDALNNKTQFVYDAAGRQVATVDALGRETQFVYDDINRVIETRFADGSSSRVDYPELNVEEITDANGNTTRFEYDAEGHLTGVIDALENQTEYLYDELGRLVEQKDANNNSTLYQYDGVARRVGVTLAEGQTSSTTYDPVGNVASKTDFNGQTITYEYDALDRLTRELLPNNEGTVFYTYSPTGQIETVIDQRGTTTFTYDEQDRLLSRTEPDGRTISYTYDLAGNRTSIVSPGGTTTYSFDALNRIDTVSDSVGSTTSYAYDAVSNLILTELGNGTQETREYDLLNRLSKLETTGVGTNILSTYEYIRDDIGNILTIKEGDTRSVDYIYDDLYRLMNEVIIDTINGSRNIVYTYDSLGNRLTRNDSAEGINTYSYNDNNQLLSAIFNGETTIYTYDGNGQLVSLESPDGTVSLYDWDSRNRIISINIDNGLDSISAEYEYDFNDFLVAKTVNNEKNNYTIDISQPFTQIREESTLDGTIQSRYIHGLGISPILKVHNDNVFYYHGDQVDSTRLLTNEIGAVTDSYLYDAFGRVLARSGDTENEYLYTGERVDNTSGLIYLRSRYLDDNIGRFISRDSFDGFLNEPITRNSYIYANDNPVNLIDPSGNFGLPSSVAEFLVSNGIVQENGIRVAAGGTLVLNYALTTNAALTLLKAGFGFATLVLSATASAFFAPDSTPILGRIFRNLGLTYFQVGRFALGRQQVDTLRNEVVNLSSSISAINEPTSLPPLKLDALESGFRNLAEDPFLARENPKVQLIANRGLAEAERLNILFQALNLSRGDSLGNKELRRQISELIKKLDKTTFALINSAKADQ